jgi:hypothetical protein
VPIILHYNKRDIQDVLTIDQLNEDINTLARPFFPTTATNGENILEGLTSIMKLVIVYLKNRLSIFQKDKTVMFSREQMTPIKSAPAPARKSASDSGFLRADTASETPVQLKKPLREERIVPEDMPSLGGDIFNLGDENLVVETSDDPIFDVPEVSLEDAMKSDDHNAVSDEYLELREPIAEADDAFSLSQTDMIEDTADRPTSQVPTLQTQADPGPLPTKASDSARSVTVPVTLTIPPGQGEVTLHLQLHIKVTADR